MDMRLHVEVWMRKSNKGYQYRGMVRRGTDYLFSGGWLYSHHGAARDGNHAASKIAKRERSNVRH